MVNIYTILDILCYADNDIVTPKMVVGQKFS